MSTSDYFSNYIKNTKAQSKDVNSPIWLKNFLEEFSDQLSKEVKLM